MTAAAQEAPAPAEKPRPLWRRIVFWAVIVFVIAAAANLLGWDIRGWFHSLWNTITTISVGSLIAAIALMIVQTTATAFAWYSILHFAYPERTRWKDILAGYAVSVALNAILPANLGTLVFLIMVTTFLSISFAAVLGAYAVEKIFFTVAGAFTYIYLFLTRRRLVRHLVQLRARARRWRRSVVLGGGILLIVMLVRRFWPRVVAWWEKAKEGGAILGHAPRLLRARVPALVHQLGRRPGRRSACS